jgi:hypothetical protein
MAASTSSLVTPIASPPLRRWAQVERRIGKQEDDLPLASGEPLYLLLFGFQKLFLLSTVAIFCCSSKSPSGLGIEYLGYLYGWKFLRIRITCQVKNSKQLKIPASGFPHFSFQPQLSCRNIHILPTSVS